MGRQHDLILTVLALATCISAFRTPTRLRRDCEGILRKRQEFLPRCTGARSKVRPRQSSGMVIMMSDRQQELQDKIRKLRSAASQGNSYERVVGAGAELAKEMKQSKEKLNDEEKAEQEKLREQTVVKGDREKAVSELEEGRRTILPDEDDPGMESNILDSLMVSRAEEFASDLEKIYMPTSSTREAEMRRERSMSPGTSRPATFDGAFGGTMSEAEAFFNKKSPFQEPSEKKARVAGGAEGTKTEPSASAASPAKVTETKDSASSNNASFQKTSGSVGGRWERPVSDASVETHKPAVGTWGVFERPKDISKAYGGGRDPTIARRDPSEVRRKDAETQALLASFRGVSSEELQKESENKDGIELALRQAKRAMLSGNPMRAVSTLEAIKKDCSTHGELGAVVFLELAMALEATGQSYQAQDIYKVLSRSKNRDIRTKAKRLNEGLEALDLLNFNRPGEEEEPSEYAKLCAESFTPIQGYNSYRSYVQKDADGRPSAGGVFAIKDAKEILMSASRFRHGISPERILRAFEFLRKRSQEADEVARKEADEALRSANEGGSSGAEASTDTGGKEPGKVESPPSASGRSWASAKLVMTPEMKREAERMQQKKDAEKARAAKRGKMLSFERKMEAPLLGKAGLVALVGDLESLQERVQGGWKLVVRAGDGKVSHVENDAMLNLAPDGMLKAVEPVGFVPVSKQGEWEFDSEERTITLAYKSSKIVGLMDVGGAREELVLVALDDKLLVATERRDRGIARKAKGAVGGKTRKIKPKAFKYRLLVRE